VAYAKRSIHVSLAQVISHIAAVETNGDRTAAIAELVTAAADGGIVAFARSDEISEPELPRLWWQDIKRGAGRISDDAREIIITTKRWNSLFNKEETRTIRFYDIEFYRTDVLELWPSKPRPEQAKSAPQSTRAATDPSPASKPRAAYRNELRTYLAPRDLATLVRQGKDAVAAEFIAHCRQHKPSLAAVLPKPREVAKQVQKILDSRRPKPQQSSTRERPQAPSSSPNRG
jgi:hypothetical protein